MTARDRVVTVQKGRIEDADRLNAEYWEAIPPNERLAMVWDMVREHPAWTGKPDASQSRLQRSVLRVERR